jgi:hypothetical protein
LAWAQATIAAKGAAAVGEPVELSTGAFEAPSSRLTVRIARVQDRQATVGITASCSKGRRTLHTARDYTIDLP